MVKTSSLYFNRVSIWEDVYENWFLKEKLVLQTGESGVADNLIPGVFGQSWTLLEESDAMWRIYSKINDPKNGTKKYLADTSVRIRTTARKLFDAIYTDDKDVARAYIGKVEYLSQSDFDKLRNSLSPLSPLDLNEAFVRSYFYKRSPFEHEQEVRPLLIYSPKETQFGKDGVMFSIDSDTFIEEIVVDPRLSAGEYHYISGTLISLGIYNNKIRQSELYRLQPHTIQLL